MTDPKTYPKADKNYQSTPFLTYTFSNAFFISDFEVLCTSHTETHIF